MISALFLERVCQYSSLCAIRTDWRIQRNVYRIGTRSVWDYRIWQNIIPTKQVHSILLVTLCNKFILILQPNLISNVSILGQWIYHDFESIQPCISSFSFPWDMVIVLSPYFSSDSIFFLHIMTINLSWSIKFNIKSMV